MLEAWGEYSHYWPTMAGQARSQVIWLNSSINVNGQPVFWKKCFVQGVVCVTDLIDEEGKVMCYNQFVARYDRCLTWLEYRALIKSIPNSWLGLIKLSLGESGFVSKLQELLSHINPSREVYTQLVTHQDTFQNQLDRWNKSKSMHMTLQEYEKHFVNIHCVTNATK